MQMSVQRIAVWIGGAALLGAWIASAAGVPRVARLTYRTPRVPPDVAAVDHLAADVQAQAVRLRERMASAPAPQAAIRNPFTFSAIAAPPRVARAVAAAPVEQPVAPTAPEPVMELIGIAEDKGPKGLVRTAMISGPQNDLVMATAGERILGIYDVIAVGADAVELKHAASGAVRRLALR